MVVGAEYSIKLLGISTLEYSKSDMIILTLTGSKRAQRRKLKFLHDSAKVEGAGKITATLRE